MTYSFDSFVVALPVLIAIYVSYTVVGLSVRVSVARRMAPILWTVGGAFAMVSGIWAMHFIGMLAFSLPIPVHYDLVLTVVSIVPAVCASAIALFMVRLGVN